MVTEAIVNMGRGRPEPGMPDWQSVGRVGVAVVITTVVITTGLGGGAAVLQPSFSVSATTTVGDEPVTSIAFDKGQSVEFHIDYAELGDRPHDLVISMRATDEPVLLTRRLDVSGSSGSLTVRLDELFDLSGLDIVSSIEFRFRIDNVGPDGEQILTETMDLDTVPATVYLTDVPAVTRIDQTVTVGYYGWGREPLVDGIGLYADRPPLGIDEQGEDTLLARATVESSQEVFFTGGFEFVPADALDQIGDSVDLQVRPLAADTPVPGSNVETLGLNRPPKPVISVSPDEPTVGEPVSFFAGDSSDPEGVIVEYLWDLNDDGEFEAEGRSVSETYDSAGPHTVTLMVVDDDGASTSTEVSFRAITPEPENNPPNAVIDYTPKSPTVGESVTFTAEASFDEDGAIDEYQWDLDGDDEYETFGQTVDRDFDTGGRFSVGLRVIDNDGASDVATLSVWVVTPTPDDDGIPDLVWLVGGLVVGGALLIGIMKRMVGSVRWLVDKLTPNHNGPTPDNGDGNGDEDGNDKEENEDNRPPTGVAPYLPREPRVNRPVLFDGSLSFDPDPGDRIVDFRWTVDDDVHRTPRFVHVFSEAGDHEVTLTVTDNHGAVGSYSETVSITDPEGDLVLDSVHPDSPGDDHENLDHEYLVFRNDGDAALDLSGWTLHDAAQEEGRVRPDEHTFPFPDGTELDPGATATVHTGSGEDDRQEWAATDEARHLFWSKGRAVWNNEGDRIVVEDGEGHPVLAARYRRTDAGEYDIEPIEVQQLLDWFPAVEVSGSADTPAGGLGFGLGLESLGAIRDFVAAAFFRRGPWAFLKVWAFASVIVIGSGSIGIASSTAELAAPLVLLPVTIAMLLIGVVWLVGRWVFDVIRS